MGDYRRKMLGHAITGMFLTSEDHRYVNAILTGYYADRRLAASNRGEVGAHHVQAQQPCPHLVSLLAWPGSDHCRWPAVLLFLIPCVIFVRTRAFQKIVLGSEC